MLLAAPQLRVIHVTTHMGLLDAVEKIEPGLIYRTIRRGNDALVAAGIPRPMIAVAGIDPNAAEHGLFGRDEEKKIVPAVERARDEGIDVSGPLPADTVFLRAGRGDFDLVVAMYHDHGHGHGPVKVGGLEAGVKVTVGLPVIRTGVDHGAAFDIAGTGRADERSMVEALRRAAEFADSRSPIPSGADADATGGGERTTQQSARTAEERLRRADPVLGAIIEVIVREDGDARPSLTPDPTLPPDPNMPTDRYGVLVSAIVSQNISIIASRSIYRRLTTRFGGRPPTPQEILDADPDELGLAAGLSRAKTASLYSLAEHIVSGELDLERLYELPDEEVVAKLNVVRGIGAWTADMFLIFHLHRPDVLAAGDLEIRRTVKELYRLPGPTELAQIAEPWRRYRTLACLYFWRLVEKARRTF